MVPKTCHPRIILPILGAFLGYLLLHPYTMIVYILAHLHQTGRLFEGWRWKDVLEIGLSSFKPEMIIMAIPFILLGALIGFLTGLVMEKRKRLLAAAYENEKKKVALDTLHQLMVTLSHHL